MCFGRFQQPHVHETVAVVMFRCTGTRVAAAMLCIALLSTEAHGASVATGDAAECPNECSLNGALKFFKFTHSIARCMRVLALSAWAITTAPDRGPTLSLHNSSALLPRLADAMRYKIFANKNRFQDASELHTLDNREMNIRRSIYPYQLRKH